MPVDFGFNNPHLKTWLLLHQVFTMISKCEDDVFGKNGISTEQHTVLMAIKYLEKPVRPTDVAKWLDRNPNSISLIVARMVKAGTVKGIRDQSDRRLVRLVMTKKGKEILDQATVAGWKLIQDILSSVKDEDLSTLIRLLEEVKGKSFDYLNPGEVIEKVKINKISERKGVAHFTKRIGKYRPDASGKNQI